MLIKVEGPQFKYDHIVMVLDALVYTSASQSGIKGLSDPCKSVTPTVYKRNLTGPFGGKLGGNLGMSKV